MSKSLISLDRPHARFDAYCATVEMPAVEVAGTLAAMLNGKTTTDRGRFGYERRADITGEDGYLICTVYFGKNHAWPNVQAFGEVTPEVVDVIREFWPGAHFVSRCDPCMDFDKPGAWDFINEFTMKLADHHGIVYECQGDYDKALLGRTRYFGARSSRVRLRVYEKGRQLMKDGINASPDLVRVEGQIRPEKIGRELMAKATPGEAFGYGILTRAVYEELAQHSIEPIRTGQKYATTLDRSLHAMARQYGKTFMTLSQREGSDCAAGNYLAKLIRTLNN